MYWDFPSGDLGERKNVVSINGNYKFKGIFNARITHMFNDPGSTIKLAYTTKDFNRKIKDITTAINSSIDAVYVDKFYQKTSGWGKVATSINTKTTKGNWSLDTKLSYQHALDKKRKKLLYFSTGASKKF